jgi:transposase
MEFGTNISSLHTLIGSLLEKMNILESRVLVLESENVELRSENVELRSENAELRSENAQLRSENAELRTQITLNSNNSHKPPSSDGYSKRPALPKNEGKKKGGQTGHNGKTLEMVSHADEVIVHYATICSCCGKPLCEKDVIGLYERRQVFDMPPPRLWVQEHQVWASFCCGQNHFGSFPTGVCSAAQYGNNILSLSSVLNNDYQMPFGKISRLLFDLYGCSLNVSTIVSANESLYEQLVSQEKDIKDQITSSEVVHFDETGMRVAGKLHWFHTACTSLATYLFVHTKRGEEALQDPLSLLKDFKNWAIHDCWASYFYFTGCKHAICNAHILRELFALTEQGSIWAKYMHVFLFELYQASQKGTQLVNDKENWLKKYQDICLIADQQEPPPLKGKRGKPKNTKGRNLLNRLVKHQDAVLAFAFVEKVVFTNNLAEQSIRNIKIKQKVSMSFRTFRGAQVYARIQSFIATMRKNGQDVFKSVIQARQGKNPLFTIS